MCLAIAVSTFLCVAGWSYVALSISYNTRKMIQKAMMKRYSVGHFNSNYKLPEQLVQTIIDAARLSPSSYGLQPYRVYVLENKEMQKKLVQFSCKQEVVQECSTLLIFATKKDFTELDAQQSAKKFLNKNPTMLTMASIIENSVKNVKASLNQEKYQSWLEKQTFLAFGFSMMAAALLNVGSTPLEGFQPEEYDEMLGIGEDGYTSTVLLALGKESKAQEGYKKIKVRPSVEEFVKYLS